MSIFCELALAVAQTLDREVNEDDVSKSGYVWRGRGWDQDDDLCVFQRSGYVIGFRSGKRDRRRRRRCGRVRARTQRGSGRGWFL